MVMKSSNQLLRSFLNIFACSSFSTCCFKGMSMSCITIWSSCVSMTGVIGMHPKKMLSGSVMVSIPSVSSPQIRHGFSISRDAIQRRNVFETRVDSWHISRALIEGNHSVAYVSNRSPSQGQAKDALDEKVVEV